MLCKRCEPSFEDYLMSRRSFLWSRLIVRQQLTQTANGLLQKIVRAKTPHSSHTHSSVSRAVAQINFLKIKRTTLIHNKSFKRLTHSRPSRHESVGGIIQRAGREVFAPWDAIKRHFISISLKPTCSVAFRFTSDWVLWLITFYSRGEQEDRNEAINTSLPAKLCKIISNLFTWYFSNKYQTLFTFPRPMSERAYLDFPGDRELVSAHIVL